jgi:hypothetical protein
MWSWQDAGKVSNHVGHHRGHQKKRRRNRWFRRRCKALIIKERATGLEPATSSLGSTNGAKGPHLLALGTNQVPASDNAPR